MFQIDVKYVQDRVGEWIMLLIGESVISILVPPDPTFYAELRILAAGLLITFGQYMLFFGTYPKDPRAHVLWRSRHSGLKWWLLVSFGLPLCLISIAVGQKTLIELRIAWEELGHHSFEEDGYTTDGASRIVAESAAAFCVVQSMLALYHREGFVSYVKGLLCNSIRQREALLEHEDKSERDKSVWWMRLVFFLIKVVVIGSQIALAPVAKKFAEDYEISQNRAIDIIEFWTLGTTIIYVLVMAFEEPESVMGTNNALQNVLQHVIETSK